MKKIIALLAMLVFLAAVPAMALDVFPDLELNGKLTPEQAAYLGAGDAPFKVSDIKADYLFVEVFSMYCPICQRDAPTVNDVEEKIMAAAPDRRIKFIGLGAGNTPFEVDFYVKKFQVEFPLFHDENYVGHKALENVGTPAFYLVDMKDGRKVLFFQEGELKDPDAMVKTILDAVGE